MMHGSKAIFIGFIVVVITLSGCDRTKEIRVSDDVKRETEMKADNNKIRTEPVLKKKLSGLDRKRILFWIDDENILIKDISSEKLILYSYNLEREESTEILNDTNITKIYDEESNTGVMLIGNDRQAFVYDPKERNLKKVLDFDEEFKDGIPGLKSPKEKQDLSKCSIHLDKKGYISYISKIKSNNTAEYTIFNYEDDRKNIIDSRYSLSGINGKFDLTGKKIYVEEVNKITKLNLETGDKSSIELSQPKIINVFEDGTLFVSCLQENGNSYDCDRRYRVDFDNKKVTRYDTSYEGKNLTIGSIDFKNEFVGYTYLGDGDERDKNIAMYGKLEGDKFTVTDKLFKNNEEVGCNYYRDFIFSPDHNRFITNVTVLKNNDIDDIKKDDEYLFELK